jgi:hypothetical protein
MVWLADQLDELGRVPRFAKVIYDDVNGGCGSSRYNALDWKRHFEEKHPETSDALVSLLTIAYSNYILDTHRR